ncbi:GDSL lipase-like isoform X1 [Pistacia vera]|uniref:GDSL lipase-like isoform X1 n=1 Tax=Pistacia vera TaxID=55513 RepID=UPI0012639183|nr:GDSL lipase-like isoform X1 [Pistacia vera]
MESAAASSIRSLLYILLMSYSSLLIPPASSQGDESRQANNKHVAVFVFGDSLFDPGNNNYLNISIDGKANFIPYGESFFKYPTGRFCDGRTISDFAAMYLNLPLWEPYLQPGSHNFSNGANFASAGAGVLEETSPDRLYSQKQLSYFKKVANLLKQQLGDAEAKKILADAIYLSSFGGTDYISFIQSFYNPTELQQRERVNMVIGNFTNVIKEIYEMGGRKFAFQNVGPLGCLPLMKQEFNPSGGACVEVLQAIASLHNSLLSNVTAELQSQLSGFKYVYFDFFSSLNDMKNYPKKYGFNVSDIACCGIGLDRGSDCGKVKEYELCSDPNEYLYFDGGHQCEHANSILSNFLWNGGSNFTWPISMKQLYGLNSTIAIEILSEDKLSFSM